MAPKNLPTLEQLQSGALLLEDPPAHTDASPAQEMLARALKLWDVGEYHSAREHARKARKLAPADPVIAMHSHFLCGTLLSDFDPALAVAQLKKCLKIAGNYDLPHIQAQVVAQGACSLRHAGDRDLDPLLIVSAIDLCEDFLPSLLQRTDCFAIECGLLEAQANLSPQSAAEELVNLADSADTLAYKTEALNLAWRAFDKAGDTTQANRIAHRAINAAWKNLHHAPEQQKVEAAQELYTTYEQAILLRMRHREFCTETEVMHTLTLVDVLSTVASTYLVNTNNPPSQWDEKCDKLLSTTH